MPRASRTGDWEEQLHDHRMSISQSDWSLHRKGPKDQARHQEKVREAIKGQLGEIISNESIITSDGKKIVKVPVRSLEEYSFRYDPFKKDGVGQGRAKASRAT